MKATLRLFLLAAMVSTYSAPATAQSGLGMQTDKEVCIKTRTGTYCKA